MTNPPPGWHPDPGAPGTGRERYWDGLAWTEHVRDGAAVDTTRSLGALDPTVAVPTTASQQPTPHAPQTQDCLSAPTPTGSPSQGPVGQPSQPGFPGTYLPPSGTAYDTGGQPPEGKKGLWIVMACLATVLVACLVAMLVVLWPGGITAPTTTTTTTTLPPTTTSSSTTTSTSTTTTSSTSTTVAKQPTTYVDPSGRFKFTHPGWEQKPSQNGFTVFWVDANGGDNLLGGQFRVKHSPGMVLNEQTCSQQGGTIETYNVGGTPSKFCRTLSQNKLVTAWIGFPAVGGTNVAVAYSTLILADPAQVKLPADVTAAMASISP